MLFCSEDTSVEPPSFGADDGLSVLASGVGYLPVINDWTCPGEMFADSDGFTHFEALGLTSRALGERDGNSLVVGLCISSWLATADPAAPTSLFGSENEPVADGTREGKSDEGSLTSPRVDVEVGNCVAAKLVVVESSVGQDERMPESR